MTKFMDYNAYYQKAVTRKQALEQELQKPEVLSDTGNLAKLNREYSQVNAIINLAETRTKLLAELEHLQKNLNEENDTEMRALIAGEIGSHQKKLPQVANDFKELVEPSDPLDAKDTIVEIRAGAGGDEAALFSAELLRLYLRWAERQGWQAKIISASRSDLGGYKEVILEIIGHRVYSQLKYESGVHRVQRIPATEKNGRVHTSTVTVAVLPKADEVDLDIKPEELKIEATTASGHGGQSVNTTYSAIRIVHLPTGLTVICQDERSQKQNKEKAMAVLRSRLLARQIEQARATRDSSRRAQIGAGDRSEKIRTYNFPQDRLTDHRLKVNWHGLASIMDGQLEPIISELKKADS